MTPAQLATLKTAILADPVLAAVTRGPGTDYGAIAAAMSAPAAPTFVVWKLTIPTSAIGTTISYVALAAMTSANQTQLDLFLKLNTQEWPPTAGIRAFFANTFSGTLGGEGQLTRDAMEALYRRSATRAEKVLATGTGTTLSPATLNYEGGLSLGEVASMFNA
jgi:hypothetical protein